MESGLRVDSNGVRLVSRNCVTPSFRRNRLLLIKELGIRARGKRRGLGWSEAYDDESCARLGILYTISNEDPG